MNDNHPPMSRHASSPHRRRAVLWPVCLALAALLPAALVPPLPAEIVLKLDSVAANEEKPGLEVPGPGEGEEARFDMVEFLTGDKLRGTFYSIDPERGVRWRHPAIKQVLDIDPGSIASIRLNRPRSTNAPPEQSCLLKLTNQDEVFGQLVGVDGTNIVLQTWYGGRLSIPRTMTSSIAPGIAVSSAVFEGPTGLDDWKRTTSSRFQRAGGSDGGGWNYRNGAFYCAGNGSIGRDIKLPDRSSIEFDIAWSGYLQTSVAFYTDNLESYGGNAYMLQFSSGSLYLQRMTKNGNSTNLGHSEASRLAQKSKAHITILSDREDKNISLFIDGDLVKQWTDRGEFSEGTGIAFFQQGQGVVRISALRVTQWDGKLDRNPDRAADAEADSVRLGNNDQITGTLKAIHDGKMSFGTEFATLEVPLERISEINLASKESVVPDRQPTDIRAVFSDRGSVTFSIERWDDQQIVGSSPSLGQVKFLPAAFTRIDFNLDQQRTDPDLMDLGSFQRDLSALFEQ